MQSYHSRGRAEFALRTEMQPSCSSSFEAFSASPLPCRSRQGKLHHLDVLPALFIELLASEGQDIIIRADCRAVKAPKLQHQCLP